MCVVSMVMQHKYEEWQRLLEPIPTPVFIPHPVIVPRQITPEEIDEFRRLLERARQYDRDNNEPDCETEEKRRQLKDLAKKLGVKIEFV